jgi:hypothetical protein
MLFCHSPTEKETQEMRQMSSRIANTRYRLAYHIGSAIVRYGGVDVAGGYSGYVPYYLPAQSHQRQATLLMHRLSRFERPAYSISSNNPLTHRLSPGVVLLPVVARSLPVPKFSTDDIYPLRTYSPRLRALGMLSPPSLHFRGAVGTVEHDHRLK